MNGDPGRVIRRLGEPAAGPGRRLGRRADRLGIARPSAPLASRRFRPVVHGLRLQDRLRLDLQRRTGEAATFAYHRTETRAGLNLQRRQRDLVGLQHGRPDRQPGPALRPVVPVEQKARQADGHDHRDPLLDLADPLLDLVGEERSPARTSATCSTGRHQVGDQQLERGQLEDAAVRYAAVRKPGRTGRRPGS